MDWDWRTEQCLRLWSIPCDCHQKTSERHSRMEHNAVGGPTEDQCSKETEQRLLKSQQLSAIDVLAMWTGNKRRKNTSVLVDVPSGNTFPSERCLKYRQPCGQGESFINKPMTRTLTMAIQILSVFYMPISTFIFAQVLTFNGQYLRSKLQSLSKTLSHSQ